MCIDFKKMAPKIKVQAFFFFFLGDHFFIFLRASYGKFGQVWGKLEQK